MFLDSSKSFMSLKHSFVLNLSRISYHRLPLSRKQEFSNPDLEGIQFHLLVLYRKDADLIRPL